MTSETAVSKRGPGVGASPKDVKTYDLKPEMSAYQVCDIVLKEIEAGVLMCTS